MLEGANARTLAIVDEIGGGTEPSAGAALAIAMLERLLVCGARAIVSTHAIELKLFAHATAERRECQRALRPEDLRADLRARRRHAGPVVGVSACDAAGHRPADRRARGGAARTPRARLRGGLSRARAAQQRAARITRGELERERAAASRRARTRCIATATNSTRSGAVSARGPRSACSKRCAISCASSNERQAERGHRPRLLAQTLEAMRRELGIRPDDETAESADAYSRRGSRTRALAESRRRRSKIGTKGCSFRSVQ